MNVALLGASGIIAPAILRDLIESDEIETVLLLDLNPAAAEQLAAEHGGGRATVQAVDATNSQQLAKHLTNAGAGLLVNAASYRINLAAMDAALQAGCDYVDLGGLFHVMREQLDFADRFTQAGRLAILGVGAGPGKTNVMAAHAARHFDQIDRVRCSSAGRDLDPPDGLSVPYALATLIDEIVRQPMICRDGQLVPIDPLTDGGTIPFPEPVGSCDSLFTLHSEVLMLHQTLQPKHCDFRLSLAPAVLEKLKDIAKQNLTPEQLRAIPTVRPSAKTFSAQHVLVEGTLKDGARKFVTMTALTEPNETWGLGGGIISTASVAAAFVRLHVRGALRTTTGLCFPEQVVDPPALFAELEQRGCSFVERQHDSGEDHLDSRGRES